MSVPAPSPIVEMQDIYKSYGSLLANRGISFSLLAGEIHGLLGENGAGKTTLMRVLFGLSRPDSGLILVEGQPVEIRSPKDALTLGIGMVTQHFALVPPLTVTENVILGQTAGFHLDLEQAHRQVAEAAQRFGIRVDPHARVMDLSVGERQRVEILKALYRNVRVLILDEPTAVLTPQEVEQLFESLRHLRQRGLSVVFISHKLHEVMDICDRVTVLRDGEVVGTVPVSHTSQAELARLMVGRATFGVTRKEQRPSEGEVLLRLEDLHALDNRGLPALQGVDLEVRSGEILGLAGVSGNGQTELAEVLSGTRNCSRGRVLLMGRDMTNAEPVALTAAGVGRIPEDRHEAVIPELSVADNLALEHLGDFTRRGVLDARAIREHARRLIEQYQIKARPEDPARTLSGGNLQKLVLARVLERNPRVLIVAQPTRGLDVGATEYIRSKLLEQRDRGAAILLISEDLGEILDLSDRIAVIFEGRIMATLPARQADPETLGLLMSGVIPGAEKTAAAAGSH